MRARNNPQKQKLAQIKLSKPDNILPIILYDKIGLEDKNKIDYKHENEVFFKKLRDDIIKGKCRMINRQQLIKATSDNRFQKEDDLRNYVYEKIYDIYHQTADNYGTERAEQIIFFTHLLCQEKGMFDNLSQQDIKPIMIVINDAYSQLHKKMLDRTASPSHYTFNNDIKQLYINRTTELEKLKDIQRFCNKILQNKRIKEIICCNRLYRSKLNNKQQKINVKTSSSNSQKNNREYFRFGKNKKYEDPYRLDYYHKNKHLAQKKLQAHKEQSKKLNDKHQYEQQIKRLPFGYHYKNADLKKFKKTIEKQITNKQKKPIKQPEKSGIDFSDKTNFFNLKPKKEIIIPPTYKVLRNFVSPLEYTLSKNYINSKTKQREKSKHKAKSSFSDFLERQEDFIKKRKEFIKKQQQSNNAYSFKPKLSKNNLYKKVKSRVQENLKHNWGCFYYDGYK